MISIVDKLDSLIDETVSSLNKATFTQDPIAGKHFSKIVSVMSSAYKRHGSILEVALREVLKNNPKFEVWDEKKFPVSQSADQMVSAAADTPHTISGVNLPQNGAARTLQVDLLIYNKETGQLNAYEVKRGNGLHDSGKKRSMIHDTLCTQILLKSYGESKGFNVSSVQSYIIFYYGKCSVGAPWAIKGNDLDAHFDFAVQGPVEEVNKRFIEKLHSIL